MLILQTHRPYMDYTFSYLQQTSSWKEIDILSEVRFKASLSGGSGGQNVNKVSTKMELYWTPANSTILDEKTKNRLISKLAKKLNTEGELRIVCDEERSQLLNKVKLIEKFYALLANCFKEPKLRRKSKPTKSSITNRLDEKKVRKEIKKGRGKIDY